VVVVSSVVVVLSVVVVVAGRLVDVVLPTVVGVPVTLTTTWPVVVSTVVPGGRSTITSWPECGSMMRARRGSGRTTSPLGAKDTGVAGWLGGRAIGRPSLSVGPGFPGPNWLASERGVSVPGHAVTATRPASSTAPASATPTRAGVRWRRSPPAGASGAGSMAV